MGRSVCVGGRDEVGGVEEREEGEEGGCWSGWGSGEGGGLGRWWEEREGGVGGKGEG